MEKWGLRFGKYVPKVKPADLLQTWRIVRGDLVQVIAGRCTGQQGKVLRVQRDRNGLIVEGVNLVKRHVSADISGGKKGSTITLEQPISAANVALVDPSKKYKHRQNSIVGMPQRPLGSHR
jgi:large subunit ribosomal protein L24